MSAVSDPVLPADVGTAPVLDGVVVRLVPLDGSHVAGLAAAGAERDGPEYFGIPGDEDAATAFVAAAADEARLGRRVAFAVVRVADDRVVGSSSFLNPLRWSGEPAERVVSTVEIGSTWFAASVRGTTVNPACKLLMLEHAFGVWAVRRVEFRVDSRNARSLAAMEKLGAQRDGVLRSAQPGKGRDGSGGPRDTVVFSLLAAEWPAVRSSLADRLIART